MTKPWWAQLFVGQTPVSDPMQAGDRPDARFEAEWRSLVKWRVLIMLGCLGLWAVAVAEALLLSAAQHQPVELASFNGRLGSFQ